MDRNSTAGCNRASSNRSLSARRAWIEIRQVTSSACRSVNVALRKESVDRNLSQSFLSYLSMAVALRKESVDRNRDISLNYKEVLVALRKESVDRNSVTVSL